MHALFAAQRRPKRSPSAFVASGVVHAILCILLISFWRNSAPPGSTERTESLPSDLVWLGESGPGGGGGGGGNRRSDPPRQAEMPGRDRVTVPVARPAATSIPDKGEPASSVQRLDIPVRAFAASDLMLPGVLEAAPDGLSQGTGQGDGAGPGKHSGIGSGDGDGLGPGRNPGIGGMDGMSGGVMMPLVLHQEKPQYTLEAMRAGIQGAVIVECVVQPSG